MFTQLTLKPKTGRRIRNAYAPTTDVNYVKTVARRREDEKKSIKRNVWLAKKEYARDIKDLDT